MDFYYSPGTCAQATHVMLREADLPFTARKVDVFTRRLEDGNDFAAVNPNGYVPALVLDDGMLLTESAAILDWIATQRPSLMPAGLYGRTRHLQMLTFLSSEVQKPFVRLFFSEEAAERVELAATLFRRLDWAARGIGGRYLFGDAFSGADALLYVMLRWAAMLGMAVPVDLSGLAARVEERDAVRATLAFEELEPLGKTACVI